MIEMMPNEPRFEHAEDALKWAVEVLRKRRLPKSHGFWRELASENEFVAEIWEGKKNLTLPQGGEERLLLALKVMDALDAVQAKDAAMGKLLKLWVWGDWADEGRLAAALAIQEKCRREGVKVRISYRYTFAQLGVLTGLDRKAVWRKVQEGLAMLEDGLVGKGVMARFEVPSSEDNHFKKSIYFHDFKL